MIINFELVDRLGWIKRLNIETKMNRTDIKSDRMRVRFRIEIQI